MKPEDICAHTGDDYDRFQGAVSPPVYQTSLFTRKRRSSGYAYSRIANPTTEIAEKKIAALEGGEAARCFASGMAAISSCILHYSKAGCHLIAPANVYLPVRGFLNDYLSRFDVDVSFVSVAEEIGEAIRPETSLIYLETPVSNIFELQDLAAVASLAREKGITTVADNSWATPLHQNPIRLGIDLVVHSASKYLGGHSDIIGGVVVGREDAIQEIASNERGTLGGVMAPHDAWLLIRSLRTLPVRMKQHGDSALEIAKFLESHPKIERVLHPGLASHPQRHLAARQMSGSSGVFSFVPAGTTSDIRGFLSRLELFEEGPSWGGYESIFNTPGVGITESLSRELRIPMGLVRVSIGLEHPESLIQDLDRALETLQH